MSVAPGLERSYNTRCAECGLHSWQHESGCSYDRPADQPAAGACAVASLNVPRTAAGGL